METTNSTESTGSTANSQNDVASNFEDATQSSSNHTEDIGDNGSEIEKTETNPSQTQTSTDEVSLEELTEKQRQILQAVCERPHATQAELAELFDVSRATISQRVNAIDNFEWSNRKEFVDSLFDDEDVIQHRTDHAVSFDQVTTHIENLSNRIDELEQTIENKSEASGTPFNDPEIAATVVRACIDSECVDEDQEQEIIVKLIESK